MLMAPNLEKPLLMYLSMNFSDVSFEGSKGMNSAQLVGRGES